MAEAFLTSLLVGVLGGTVAIAAGWYRERHRSEAKRASVRLTMPRGNPEQSVLSPGELAPVSGIYRVVHLSGHREPHLAVIIRGEQLPSCRTCKGNVRFAVVQMASHVTTRLGFGCAFGIISAVYSLRVCERARLFCFGSKGSHR